MLDLPDLILDFPTSLQNSEKQVSVSEVTQSMAVVIAAQLEAQLSPVRAERSVESHLVQPFLWLLLESCPQCPQPRLVYPGLWLLWRWMGW